MVTASDFHACHSLPPTGWDVSVPTVYIAEGLVRYLPPPVLEAMMRTASQVPTLLAASSGNLHDMQTVAVSNDEQPMMSRAQPSHFLDRSSGEAVTADRLSIQGGQPVMNS